MTAKSLTPEQVREELSKHPPEKVRAAMEKATAEHLAARVEAPEGEVPVGMVGVIRDGTRWRTVVLELTGADWRALKRRAKLSEKYALGFIDAQLAKEADLLMASARNLAAGPKVKR